MAKKRFCVGKMDTKTGNTAFKELVIERGFTSLSAVAKKAHIYPASAIGSALSVGVMNQSLAERVCGALGITQEELKKTGVKISDKPHKYRP